MIHFGVFKGQVVTASSSVFQKEKLVLVVNRGLGEVTWGNWMTSLVDHDAKCGKVKTRWWGRTMYLPLCLGCEQFGSVGSTHFPQAGPPGTLTHTHTHTQSRWLNPGNSDALIAQVLSARRAP